MLYYLETRTQVLSMHLTLDAARDALREYNLTDKTGVTASISEIDLSTKLYTVGSLVVFGLSGLLLAWRG